MRAFLAIDFGDDVERALHKATTRLRARAPDARWVEGAVHLTLVFLGSVDDDRVTDIAKAAAAAAARSGPFRITVEGGGTFGSVRKPRVLWMGVGGDTEALGELQGAVATALEPLGIEREQRPFRAHITLARAKAERGNPALAACATDLAGLSLGEVMVREIVLYRSELRPTGAIHTPVERMALREA